MIRHPQHNGPEMNNLEPAQPRWPAVVATLAIGGLDMVLPASLVAGPRWLLLVIVSVLLIPTIVTHRTGRHSINHVLGQLVAAIVTGFTIWSVARLVQALPAHSEPPVTLLRSAAALWVSNILVFASWYWRLDAGGPHIRDQRPGHPNGAFLFPQMTLDTASKDEDPRETWSPQFVDYLFLAFNTSTALSPTDTPVLSRWAKVLCMIQASISLTIIVILAARAVNIL
jgi:hypothetical protein